MPDEPKSNDSNPGNPDSDEDDWSTYASAGYAYSVVDTDEATEIVEPSEDEWFDGDDKFVAGTAFRKRQRVADAFEFVH